MKLIFPPNCNEYIDQDGVKHTPDANRSLDIGGADPSRLIALGFSPVDANVGPTNARPAGSLPGMQYFDTTLNKPVWRNAANTGWVDATGSAA